MSLFVTASLLCTKIWAHIHPVIACQYMLIGFTLTACRSRDSSVSYDGRAGGWGVLIFFAGAVHLRQLWLPTLFFPGHRELSPFGDNVTSAKSWHSLAPKLFVHATQLLALHNSLKKCTFLRAACFLFHYLYEIWCFKTNFQAVGPDPILIQNDENKHVSLNRALGSYWYSLGGDWSNWRLWLVDRELWESVF